MALPNTFYFGGAKTGSTSFYHLMKQHPEICVPGHEESEFFLSDFHFYRNGIDWYEWFYFRSYVNQKVVFDMHPDYLFQPLAQERIKQICDVKKIIVIIRNPVDRARSHYLHNLGWLLGNEDRPFLEAVRDESKQLDSWPKLDGFNMSTKSYISKGNFYPVIVNSKKRFSGADWLFLDFDNFVSDMVGSAKNIFRFLNVDPEVPVKPVHANKGSVRSLRYAKSIQVLKNNGAKETFNIPALLFVDENEQVIRKILNPSKRLVERCKLIQPLYTKNVLCEESIEIIKKNTMASLGKLEKVTGLDLSHWTERFY